MENHKKQSTGDEHRIQKRKEITDVLVKRKLRGLSHDEAAKARKLVQEDIRAGRAPTRVSGGVSLLQGLQGLLGGLRTNLLMDYDPVDSVMVKDYGHPGDSDQIFEIDMTDSTD